MSIGNFLLWVNKKIHLPALRIYDAPGQGSFAGWRQNGYCFNLEGGKRKQSGAIELC